MWTLTFPVDPLPRYVSESGFASIACCAALCCWSALCTAGFVEQSRALTESNLLFDLDAGHSAEEPRLRRLAGSLFGADDPMPWHVDLAVMRRVPIGARRAIEVRAEAFNFLNTPQFSGPSRSLGAADFGRINSTILNNREMQIGLKYIF